MERELWTLLYAPARRCDPRPWFSAAKFFRFRDRRDAVGRPIAAAGGYLLGDSAFDSNPLHETTTYGGRQLIALHKRPGTGTGHCRQSSGRLRSIELLEGLGEFGRKLHFERDDIERRFGRLTNHAAGLAPLPNWGRRLDRVRLWGQLKLLIHAAYVFRKEHPPPITVA